MIEVTESGIVYSVRSFPFGYVINSVLSLLNNTPFKLEKYLLFSDTVILVKLEQL